MNVESPESSGIPYNGISAELDGIFWFRRNYITEFRKIRIPSELFFDGIMVTLNERIFLNIFMNLFQIDYPVLSFTFISYTQHL